MRLSQTTYKHQTLVECVALLAIATILRVWFVGKTDLGGDESFSLYVALQRIPDIVAMLTRGDNPPLWEVLLHFWIKVFGISEVSVRSLSLIFSILTVIPIYLLGERHFCRFVGAAASLCYCFSTFSIYMAHECRVYSLIGFFTACSAFLYISCIRNPKTVKFVLLTLANLMLMLGHYLSVWIIVMEFAITLFFRPVRKRIWKPYFIHAAVLILVFTPMFPVLFTRFFDSGINGTWIPKTTSLEALYDFLWRMCNVPVTTVLAIVILVSTLAKTVVDMATKKFCFSNVLIISILWIVPLLVSFALSFFTGFFLDRYFYFIFPFFYLAMAAYCVFLFPKRTAFSLGLAAVFTLAMALTCSPDSSTKRFSGWHSPIKPIVNQLVEEKKNENALVVLPEYFDKQFTYYLDENHEIFHTQSQPTNYYVFQDYLHSHGYYYDYSYPQADLNHYSKVVFAYHKVMPINGLVEYLENNGFRLEKEVDEHPFLVCYYSR